VGNNRRFNVLVGVLACASACAFAYSLLESSTSKFTVLLSGSAVVLALLAIVGEQLTVWFADKLTMTASNLPILLAIMFLGRTSAMVVGGLVGLWGCWAENAVATAAFNWANAVFPAFLAGTAFMALQSGLGFSIRSVSLALLGSGALAGLVYEIANVALVGAFTRLKYQRSFRSVWREEVGPFFQSMAIVTALGVAVAGLYAEAGIAAVVLLFIPLLASQYMFKLLVREREHLAKQKELSDQYLEMNIGLAAAMVVLLDSKDEYTASHSAGVAMYCRDMAQVLGLPEADAEALHLAGLLHDLGKVGTPDAILRKEGSLTESEWEYIRQHPGKGAEVLSHFVAYKDVAAIVRFHHERLDGSGYPDGVEGDRIPELSKILAVADSYHAMTSNRPYRKAMSSFEALKELRSIAGISLEAQYVEALARVLRDKSLAYRDGTSTDFMLEYERGRINLRLRGQSLADLSGTAVAQEDPAVG
jgi:putative nucleotidyltransferase with HDIG domain